MSCSSHLANYAVTEHQSTGRNIVEIGCATRSEFQRDRDRVIHCTAFRRLEYKTQVFINHEGDLYRTRLTHSLEVAQIARSIARALKLNEDLTEAIALAHDLGHTPFGHAGQDALNLCMKNYGGFEHNFQSLRVVDELEEKYPEFNGLNLMFETREGILKHCSARNARHMGALGERFINRTQPSLEAQLTNIADEIAYNNHDVDDGLRSGLITLEQLTQVDLFAHHFRIVEQKYPKLTHKKQAQTAIRNIIDQCVRDLINHTNENILSSQIETIHDVRASSHALVSFSADIRERMTELKSFLHKNLYQHRQVNEMSDNARKIISVLFESYFQQPDLLPEKHQYKASIKRNKLGDVGFARVISDYIAGMTDRYAEAEYQRLHADSRHEK